MPSCFQRRLLFGTDEERPAKCLESTLDGIPHFLGAVFWAYEGEKCGQRFLFVADNVSRVARIRHLVSMMTPCAEYLAAYLHSFSSIAGSHKLNTGALHHISFLMNIWGVDMRCKCAPLHISFSIPSWEVAGVILTYPWRANFCSGWLKWRLKPRGMHVGFCLRRKGLP